MSEEKKTSSVSEDNWKELAGMIRVALLKVAKTLPAMDSLQRETFISNCRDALQFETWAEIYDKDVELLLARTNRESD